MPVVSHMPCFTLDVMPCMHVLMPHRVDRLSPPADGRSQEVGDVQIGLRTGGIPDANCFVSELRALG